MKTFFKYGAMYAVVSPDEIEAVPIQLGDGTLYPGEFVKKLGQGSRTFCLSEGYYLRYVGTTMEDGNKLLLFAVNLDHFENLYYAFYYVAASTLFFGGIGFGRDVYMERLEKFVKLPADADIEEVVEQLSLWEVGK